MEIHLADEVMRRLVVVTAVITAVGRFFSSWVQTP